MSRLSLAVPAIFALCTLMSAAQASVPRSQSAEATPKAERTEQPALQKFAQCGIGQEYQSAWIQEHWAYFANVGYRVVDVTYHSAGCIRTPVLY